MDERFVKPLWCRLASGRTSGLARDSNSGRTEGETLSRYCGAQAIVDDVRRNIEVILNSRLPVFNSYFLSETSLPLDRSTINFGIVDFNSITVDDQDQEGRFCKSVVHAINSFEPRVNEVRVKLLKSLEERFIALDIMASLNVHPFEDLPIKFGYDTESQQFVAGN